MSGSRNTLQPDLGLLERLSNAPIGTIRVDETGKRFTMDDTGMTFRSGFNRLFKQGKSDEDIQQNRETLRSLLDEIEDKAGPEVLEKVMARQLRMSGDRENYTVAQRLERGTYVSGKLVAELLQITRGVIDEENAMISESNAKIEEEHGMFKNVCNIQIDGYMSKDFETDISNLRGQSGIEDEHTWNAFERFARDNKERVKDSFNGMIGQRLEDRIPLGQSEVRDGVRTFLKDTLLSEFLEAQPQRSRLEQISDHEITDCVRQRLEGQFPSHLERHVDSFLTSLVKKKEDEDDDDTPGMKNLNQIRSSVAGQLEKQGRTILSKEELIEEMDLKQLLGMVQEHMLRR